MSGIRPEPHVVGDDAPPSVAEAHRLISSERTAMARRTFAQPSVYYVTWGLVWLVGFGLTFLQYGLDGRAIVVMPGAFAGVTFGTLLVAGAVVTVVVSARSRGRIAGASNERGVMYGLAWGLAFAMVWVVAGRFSGSLPPVEVGLLWAALSTGVVGAMYACGAAIWRDRPMFALGVWVSAVNVAGVVAGPGWHSLLMSVAGGGGLLVTGVVMRVRDRSACDDRVA
jgi:hypothetical protein